MNLGTAGTFAILTKTGVTDVYASAINGNVGASPITGAAIGLSCPEVQTGIIYSVDAAGPVCKVTDPTLLTTADGDLETAYNDAAATNVTLAGGAQAKNVFWQSAGAVSIGTTAHFEGTILANTMIAMNTGASTNGRLLAQTAATLQQNTITLPAP